MGKSFKANNQIVAKEIRLIDVNGHMVGVCPLEKGLSMAAEQNLDLIEISATASPPVCRIADLGKLKYQAKKKLQLAKKKQKKVELKEVKMKPSIEAHDLDVKIKQVTKFIQDGAQVKIYMKFKGREVLFSEQGRKVLDKIWDSVSSIATKDYEPKFEGRNMVMQISQAKNR
nr:translation initiation factor IF-3 [Candidatus Sneabacter namystus]